MCSDLEYEVIHQQFEPMIYHAMKRLSIYRDKEDFYQIGCIGLWEAVLRFDKEKGEFKSYAYSYILGHMKMALSKAKTEEEKDRKVEEFWVLDVPCDGGISAALWEPVMKKLSSHLTDNQMKWVNAYCLYGYTPTEIAKDEGVSIPAVKAWRRGAIANLRKHFFIEDAINR
ncbi:sigma-70 family RNA polymerase sigma factor [Metabacillus litoralis]|uniref:sigma-70 family RNA polymerase sigma factor n=1 Tax=Metabacillus litoralis TaxID=152268 RepID=UPI00203CB5A4|nr:sigma-70 family RNA polymerase sigma factor [Metabacillus litoralis]MCM3163722.1 sigma-70 family RNA polymerase sigma factor [Metabacillus litoralis]